MFLYSGASSDFLDDWFTEIDLLDQSSVACVSSHSLFDLPTDLHPVDVARRDDDSTGDTLDEFLTSKKELNCISLSLTG